MDVSPELTRDGRLLSETVRGVRKFRGMTTREVAVRMNMSLRSYQRFEAGVTRLNFDYVKRFAAATGGDA